MIRSDALTFAALPAAYSRSGPVYRRSYYSHDVTLVTMFRGFMRQSTLCKFNVKQFEIRI
ncbi:MAG: hypothetical protein DMF61_17365 [Blastocatellia bacterium AA13]|nr:MAG: hypothetical protein DMF61_17365 [Blastocatellia bacterium AA13]